MFSKIGQTFWDNTVQTLRTVASDVLKTLPSAGWRHHRKPVWCWNQKSKFLPATALRWKLRLTVCRVVVADSRHIAHPSCTEKRGSGRDCSAAGEHVIRQGLTCSVVLCFHFVQKGPSLGFWLLCTDSHPTQATWWRGEGGGFHWSKLLYQQPRWPQWWTVGRQGTTGSSSSHLHNPRDVFFPRVRPIHKAIVLLFSFFIQKVWWGFYSICCYILNLVLAQNGQISD